MSTMTYPHTATTGLQTAEWSRYTVSFPIYRAVWQGPTKNCGSVRAEYIAPKPYTARRDQVGATIQQADSLWVRDRNGCKELAALTREAEEKRLEEQQFAAYIQGLAERAKTMRFQPSPARVPEYLDDETPALYA